MAKVELIMPKMGESIMEATIIKWHKQVGDTVEQDETILDIATDKVDSEIPSPVGGKIIAIFFKEDEVVAVDTVIALIATEGEEIGGSIVAPVKEVIPETPTPIKEAEVVKETPIVTPEVPFVKVEESQTTVFNEEKPDKFFSPLVKNIAKQEGISIVELESISGTGLAGRVTKDDMQAYLLQRGNTAQTPVATTTIKSNIASIDTPPTPNKVTSISGDVEIIEMDRMRKLIADHMVMSKRTSPHVTSFVEADVTNMVRWRDSNKEAFLKKYGEKITFTPLFIEAIVQALKDFPKINCSIVEDKIYIHKNLNIGMAAALPTGNLIVPVIKNAGLYNLAGLTAQVNDLAARAREGKLKPDEVKDGTFTVTNVGTFGNVMGTPIINQPQAAILALGAIRKKPAVLETEFGDVIAVRQMMFMSLSYDHRIIDGFLGGSFLKRISDILEAFDPKRAI